MYNLYRLFGRLEYPNLHFLKRRVTNKLYGIGSHGLLFWGIALGILLLFLTPMRAEAVPFAYVINRNSNDVSVINTATNTVIATIPVGALPQGIAVTPDGSEVYVSHADAQAVFIIDTLTNTVVDIVGLPNRSQEVEITPDGMKAYVVVQDGNAVAVINTATRTVTNVIGGFNSPHGIGITPDGTKAYVTNFGPSHSGTTVSVIDISTNTIIATIPVGQGPIGVAVTPDGTKVYVANNVTSTVSVINTATNTVIATLPTVGGLIDVEITPDGTEAFVTGGPSTTIIDTATDTVISSFPLGAVKFAFTSDGTKIYAPKPLFDVSVIDVASGTSIATIPVGENPVDVAITPDAVAQTCVNPPAGLVSWWPGDGNANDLIGGNHGMLEGGMTFTSGVVGQAFILDGVDDFVRVPEVTELDGFPELTIDAWINLNAFEDEIIVSKYDSNDLNGVSYYFVVRPPGVLELGVYEICCEIGSFIAASMISNDPVIPIGVTTHVAGIWKGGLNFESYVNGIQVSGTAQVFGDGGIPASMANTDKSVFIGAYQATFVNGHFDGIIDEVEIYNRALSSSEIQAIFAAGSAGKCKPFQFSGFFQPVDNPPTINVANAGSAVPVKFSLNGNQGLDIFEVGYPKSQAIACDTTSPLDTLEETSTAGSSSLSYDPSTDQYIYVWKTNKIWANTCRQLVVKLNDGSSHVANFKFK